MNSIVLNSMYTGDFGEKKIDGEIINFYLDDNGIQNYFLSPYGYFPESVVSNQIDAIIMVYKLDGKNFEIIGKYVPDDAKYVALELSNNVSKIDNYIQTEKISYGKVPFESIYDLNAKRTKYSPVSYRGGKVYFPTKRIILSGNDLNDAQDIYPNCEICHVKEYEGVKWGSTNYRIFSKDGNTYTKNSSNNNDINKTYDVLKYVIDSPIWVENKEKVNLNNQEKLELRNVDYLGFNHIIDGAHIELLSSNWLHHYMSSCPEAFYGFFGLDNPGQLIMSQREKKNIDIFLEFSNTIIVLENKINASIVTIEPHHSCQLEKYYSFVEENEEYSNKNKKYFILCPDYRKKVLLKEINNLLENNSENTHAVIAIKSYQIKTYSELKNYLLNEDALINSKYFNELTDFIDNLSSMCEHYQLEKLSKKRFFHKIAINS